MRTLSLVINGSPVQATVEPRTHLADFLRERQFLTGTHIGCEHGVCGACTVLVDGAPARSCITYAVACDGAEITTIEGLESDRVAADLRTAFSENHALQCGYCTPGMLMTARDIVTRLPDADERRIRAELSGNLCRCTGYVGIVAAVQSVLARQAAEDRPAAALRQGLGPVGAHPPTASQAGAVLSPRAAAGKAGLSAAKAMEKVQPEQWRVVETDGVELLQSFRVPYARSDVWRFLEDLDQVARCMPGARLTKPLSDGRAEGEVTVKLGPIVSAFSGIVEIERDDAGFSGVARGIGRDARSASAARCVIAYRVNDLDKAGSRVDLSMKLLLSGALAQFSRSGLVKDVADHLTRKFAANLEARMSGAPAASDDGAALNAAEIARAALWRRITAFFRKYFRR